MPIFAVFAGWPSRGLFAIFASVATLFYTVLLPFKYTQRISFANWHYLDAETASFSLIFGVLLAWLVVANVYSLRGVVRKSGARAGVGAVLGSLLPSLLCCTPVIPTVLGLVGVSSIGIYSWSGRIQSFFALDETYFLVASAAVLLASALWTWRSITTALCLRGECGV